MVNQMMILKIRDEERFHEEKIKESNKIRKKLSEDMGENSRKYRVLMKQLREVARRPKKNTG